MQYVAITKESLKCDQLENKCLRDDTSLTQVPRYNVLNNVNNTAYLYIKYRLGNNVWTYNYSPTWQISEW